MAQSAPATSAATTPPAAAPAAPAAAPVTTTTSAVAAVPASSSAAPARTAAARHVPAPPRPPPSQCKSLQSAAEAAATAAEAAATAAPAPGAATPPPATAAAPAPASLSPPEAQEAFNHGKTLYKRQDYVGALSMLQKAYELSGHDPRPLQWIYGAQKELNLYTDMLDSLEKFITHPSAAIPDADRLQACRSFSKLVKSTGTIRVVAGESAADVVINDGPKRPSPLKEVERVDAERPVTVRVTKPGFEPFTWKGTVPAGEEVVVEASLNKESHQGHLTVDSEPGHLSTLNGKPVADGPWDRALPSGVYSVGVTAPGKISVNLDLTVQDGAQRTALVKLEPVVPRWVWVAGGVLLAGSAVLGAALLVEPSYRAGNVGGVGYTILSSGGGR